MALQRGCFWVPYGFHSEHLFTEETLRILAEDTPEKRGNDREIIEAWRKAQGIDPEMEAGGAREKHLAWLGVRGGK